MDSKQLKEAGLTRPQFDLLSGAHDEKGNAGTANSAAPRFRHLVGGLPYGASVSIRALAALGYVALVKVHTDQEIADFETEKLSKIDEAREALNKGDWHFARLFLGDAAELERVGKRDAWQITEKGREVVRQIRNGGRT